MSGHNKIGKGLGKRGANRYQKIPRENIQVRNILVLFLSIILSFSLFFKNKSIGYY